MELDKSWMIMKPYETLWDNAGPRSANVVSSLLTRVLKHSVYSTVQNLHLKHCSYLSSCSHLTVNSDSSDASGVPHDEMYAFISEGGGPFPNTPLAESEY